MYRLFLLALLPLAGGCLSPFTSRLDELNRQIAVMTLKLDETNAGLARMESQLEDTNRRLGVFEKALRQIPGLKF